METLRKVSNAKSGQVESFADRQKMPLSKNCGASRHRLFVVERLKISPERIRLECRERSREDTMRSSDKA